MSSRTKKTTKTMTSTVSSASSSATPGSTPTSRSPGRQRSSSPTMISRLEEKNALVNLNDRLAAYIDKVRMLESENLHLTTQIRSQEETISRETGNIKALYEQELADARKLMDDMGKDKARLLIETGSLKADADEWKEKFQRVDKELNISTKRLLAAEGQVNDLQARLSDAINQRKHWEQEYNKLKTEVASLEKQLLAAKKQLEGETMHRVDLQNRVQSLKEELAFNSQLHATELNESRSRTDISIEEVDGRLSAVYESKLADALLQMRADAESTIRTTREETEESFLYKLDELREMANRGDRAAMATREELRTCRRRLDELSSQNEGLKMQNAMFETRIRELEAQLQREADEHEQHLAARDSEISHLREAIEEQMREYRDLMDVKIALDLEIAAYRKLLESEEDRLHISPGRVTPMRQTLSGRKRKRLADPLLGSSMIESHASNAYSATSAASGVFEVNETDTEGKFIKLCNTSDKEAVLGGWMLKHNAGDNETSFKFHRTLKINPGAFVTIWSSDAEAVHSPPTDIVMKGQRWFTADTMVTSLSNSTGEEMATREMKKTVYRTTTTTRASTSSSLEGSGEQKRYRYQQEYAADRWGDGQRDEKCSIM